MLVSRPLAEKMQRSKVETPDAGRANRAGLPASVQELFTVEKIPRAATFRSTSAPGCETPAVAGSTTTMSFPLASGVAGVKAIASSAPPGAATTIATLFDGVPSGFRNCTDRFPAAEIGRASCRERV